MQHRPKRSLGQNFLRDRSVIERIVAALDISSDDELIEIGPGQGALTEMLVAKSARVTAIEFDRDLAPMLRRKFSNAANLDVIEADALEVDLASLVTQPPAKLVANLPYNISTPILQRLIEQRSSFSKLVLMFQREVAQRITASPGGRELGFLSVLAQNAFEIEYLFNVPPGSFYPVPRVWSAVIKLTPTPKVANEEQFRKVISVAFAQKRKTLVNNLAGFYPGIAHELDTLGLTPKARAEELTLLQWKDLVNRLG